MPKTKKNIKYRHTEKYQTQARTKKINRYLKKNRSQIINKKRGLTNISQSQKTTPNSSMDVDIVDEQQSYNPVSALSVSSAMVIAPEYIHSPKKSIDTLTKRISNLSLGKTTTIEISFIIIGHGGIISYSNGRVPQFKLPKNVSQTNVLGQRYAGFLNFGNRVMKEQVYRFLHHHEVLKNKKNLKKFLKLFNMFYTFSLKQRKSDNTLEFPYDYYANFLVNEALSKKNIHLHGDYIGIRYNYGATRAQKLYTGKKPDETSNQSDPEEIVERPLVKIFSIKVNDQEILRNTGHEIIVDDIQNHITLTEIIEHAVKKTMLAFPEFTTFPDKKIIVNVIDITCNSTENRDYPTIEFIGPPDK